ncbi:MAG TPA: proteasome assembly chaperone family protein [Candidatus Bathyarchaeota archaeon]|nr:MAG: hypothetical protein CP083_00640 [Candidatus Bathyarchaeota archaeon B24-2]HDN62637.1 proteasome assembly chaperone family protein [Candidatus Bathyarchaeota archaeon]
MSALVRVVEKKSVPEGLNMLQGIPDVGLVGVIATSHIIFNLKMEEVAYIDSDLLPPLTVLYEGLPHSPIRIFGNDRLLALVSEIAIPANALRPVMKAIVDWIERKKVDKVFSLGGIAAPNRQDIEKPKVYTVASNEETLKFLRERNMEVMERGFLVGPQALLLQYCAEKKIGAVALLAESFYNYPDPEAAAAVINALNQLIEVPVNVQELLEKGEEIRLKMRDIMRRTRTELAQMRKAREYDIPSYYVA